MVRGHLFNPPAGVPRAAHLLLRVRSPPARVRTVDCLRLYAGPAGGAAAGRGAAGMHKGPRPAGDFPAWGGRDVPDVCRLAELGQECARPGNRANPCALLLRRGTTSPRAGTEAQRLLPMTGFGAAVSSPLVG